MILTSDHLDKLRCKSPGCGCEQLSFTARCHPNAGFILRYNKPSGILGAECVVCQDLILSFALASNH